MFKKALKLVSILIITIILMNTVTIATATNTSEPLETNVSEGLDNDEAVSEAYLEKKQEIVEEQGDLVKQLKKRLRSSVTELKNIQDSLSDFHFNITKQEDRIDSLEKQIENIEIQIKRSETKIINVTKQIAIKELDITKLMEEIEVKEIQIEVQTEIISDYLTFLYYQDLTFFDSNKNEFNIFKLLLDDNTISENISEIKYLKLFEEQTGKILEKLTDFKNELEFEQKNIEINRLSLKLLKRSYQDEITNLDALKSGKKRLKEETHGQKEVYEKLAAKDIAAEEQIASEISMLTLNVHAFDSALKRIQEAGSQEEIDEAIKIRDDILRLKDDVFALDRGEGLTMLDWPISPYRGVTAYFDDPGYIARFGVAHGAIDIRAPHGSPVFAPADGIVFRASGKGSDDIGYHYLMLTHRTGFQTVYGHISKFLVSEGQFVRKGDMVALTGGTPGSTGAGLRTTGPHLHFEVHRFGQKVDPLDFLPLSALPLKYIPQDKMAQLYEQELQKQYKENKQYFEKLEKEGNINGGETKNNLHKNKTTNSNAANSDTSNFSSTTTLDDIPTAEELLKDGAMFNYEQYEKLREQYENAYKTNERYQ